MMRARLAEISAYGHYQTCYRRLVTSQNPVYMTHIMYTVKWFRERRSP
jgi:hypothetical protein